MVFVSEAKIFKTFIGVLVCYYGNSTKQLNTPHNHKIPTQNKRLNKEAGNTTVENMHSVEEQRRRPNKRISIVLTVETKAKEMFVAFNAEINVVGD